MLGNFRNTSKIQIITALVFLVYFIIGITFYQNYGISWDEPIERYMGLVNTKYIIDLFNLNGLLCSGGCESDSAQLLHQYHDKAYGSWFQVLANTLEGLFGIKDFYNAILLRHLLNFLIFFTGSVYLYRIIKYLFKDDLIALLCAILFISQPRFFAEAFYNSKDIVFLAIVCIASFYQIRFLKELDKSNGIKAAVFTGLAVATRVLGILLFIEVIVILILDIFLSGKRSKSHYKTIGIYTLVAFGSMVLFWPFLWGDPIGNFIHAFKIMSKFHWQGIVLLNGEFISSENMPWYYLPNWMAITLPELVITGIVLSLVAFFMALIKSESIKSKYQSLRLELYYFGLLLGPVFMVVVLNSVVYDGWRHVYFITAGGFIGMAWFASKLKEYINQKVKSPKFIFIPIIVLVLIQFAFNLKNLISLHPFQNVYFNNFAHKDLRKNYELDYWGLSYREGLEYILSNDTRQHIKIALIGHPGQVQFVSNEKINGRVLEHVQEIKEADYFLSTYRNHPQDYTEYHEFYKIVVNGEKIMSIFKTGN